MPVIPKGAESTYTKMPLIDHIPYLEDSYNKELISTARSLPAPVAVPRGIDFTCKVCGDAAPSVEKKPEVARAADWVPSNGAAVAADAEEEAEIA